MENKLKIQDKICYGLINGFEYTEEVVVPEGVEVIAENAFNNATNIYEVILPESIKEIKKGAFKKSTIRKIEIKSKGIRIGEDAFTNSSLYEIKCIATYLGPFAFAECESLINANLGDELKNIPKYAFHGCTALKKFHFPSNLKSIGTSAFYNCRIKEVNFPDTVEEIKSDSFLFSSVTKINVPASLRYIGNIAFGYSQLKGPIDFTKVKNELLIRYDAFSESDVKEIIIPENTKMLTPTSEVTEITIRAAGKNAKKIEEEVLMLKLDKAVTIDAYESEIDLFLAQGKSISEINQIYKNNEER